MIYNSVGLFLRTAIFLWETDSYMYVEWIRVVPTKAVSLLWFSLRQSPFFARDPEQNFHPQSFAVQYLECEATKFVHCYQVSVQYFVFSQVLHTIRDTPPNPSGLYVISWKWLFVQLTGWGKISTVSSVTFWVVHCSIPFNFFTVCI